MTVASPGTYYDGGERGTYYDGGERGTYYDGGERGNYDSREVDGVLARLLETEKRAVYEEDTSHGYKNTGCKSRTPAVYNSFAKATTACDAMADCGAIEKPYGGGYYLCEGYEVKATGRARVMVKM